MHYSWSVNGHILETDTVMIENPVDLASRSLLLRATVLCKLHQEGPSFLRLPAHQWPIQTFSTISPEKLPEYLPKLVTMSVATVSSTTSRDDIIQRFSSFTRILRVLTYVKCLVFKIHKKAIPLGPLKQAVTSYTLIYRIFNTTITLFRSLSKFIYI